MAWALKRTMKNGTVRWTGVYRDAEGRKHSAGTAPTKKVALELAADEEADIRHGQWLDPADGMLTFADYFEHHWLPNRELELNTQATYLTHYRKALKPTFGELPLRTLTTSRVQGWVTQQKRAGDSPVTIRDRFGLLQTVLAARRGASAIRDGHLRSNPCAGVTTPKVPRREVTVYTPEQSDAAIEHLGAWWPELALLLAETGCRWGEAQGLCVGDIWAGNVVLRRTIVETTKRLTGNGTPYLVKEYPKNRKPRSLAISPGLARSIEAMTSRRQLGPGDRLFAREGVKRARGKSMRTRAWPNGRPVSRNHFRDVWKRACQAAGVPDLRVHDLRASNISWMLAGGADLATVMQRAGHSQMATTQRYVTALEDADDRALTAMQALRTRRAATSGRSTPGR